MELWQLFEKGQVLFLKEKYEDSLGVFNQILDIDENVADAIFYRAKSKMKLGLEDSAADDINNYLLYALGEFNAENYELSLKIINNLIRTIPNYHNFYKYRSDFFKALKNSANYEKDIAIYNSLQLDSNKKYYLFFDTETTGLPKSWKASVSDVENWPNIVQLAYILADESGNIIISENRIVYPSNFTIPNEASRIHGITTEHARENGEDIIDILIDFNNTLENVSTLIAHNIEFDSNVLGAEYLRNSFINPLPRFNFLCTMKSSTNFCAVPGNYGFKYPKLSELHYKLFNTPLVEAHNAFADVKQTLKCFYELKKRNIL